MSNTDHSALDDHTETVVNIAKTHINGHANKAEVASWTRKRKQLEKLIVNDIHPLEQQFIELQSKLQPMYDAVATTRAEMVRTCIHPKDLLVYDQDTNTVTCKFCNTRMTVVGVLNNVESTS